MNSTGNIGIPNKARMHHSSIVESIGEILCADWFPNQQRTALKQRRFPMLSTRETLGLRVLIEAGAAVEMMNPEEMRRWMSLIHCMAIMSAPNRNPHSTANGAKPGFVLHRIGYSETRLGRLLDARGEIFQKLLDNAARQMARGSLRVNWSKIAPLILSEEASSWAENARIAICRDFLIASVKSSSVKGKAMASEDAVIMGQFS